MWIRERAGTCEHGTTRRAPVAVFEAEERTALLPVPDSAFKLVETRRAKVGTDCHGPRRQLHPPNLVGELVLLRVKLQA